MDAVIGAIIGAVVSAVTANPVYRPKDIFRGSLLRFGMK